MNEKLKWVLDHNEKLKTLSIDYVESLILGKQIYSEVSHTAGMYGVDSVKNYLDYINKNGDIFIGDYLDELQLKTSKQYDENQNSKEKVLAGMKSGLEYYDEVIATLENFDWGDSINGDMYDDDRDKLIKETKKRRANLQDRYDKLRGYKHESIKK